MPQRFKKPSRPDFRLDQMFETHSEEWERVGLAVDFDKKSLRSARRRVAVLVPLFIAVIVLYNNYQSWFDVKTSSSLDHADQGRDGAGAARAGLGHRPRHRPRRRTDVLPPDGSRHGRNRGLPRPPRDGRHHAPGGARDRRRERGLAGRDERVHRGDPRSRRAADARQPVRRDGAAERATVPRRRARPLPGGRRRRTDRGDRQLARPALHDARPGRGPDHGAEQRRAFGRRGPDQGARIGRRQGPSGHAASA